MEDMHKHTTHPDLAGREAREGTLTEASTGEQKSAGLKLNRAQGQALGFKDGSGHRRYTCSS